MKKKGWSFIKHAAGVALVLLTICICWSAAFLITSFFYRHVSQPPGAYFSLLINSLLGFFLFGGMMSTIGTLMKSKRKAPFERLNEALKQIAKGDFNVNLAFIGGGPDSHPLNELAQGINDMAAELGEMEQMRQEFISNVSHEIQSPLTSIGGFAKFARNDSLTGEERDHYLDIIESESKRLSKLSENLLKLTSLESKHHPFEPKRYRLDYQLRNIILSCEPLWQEKRIEMDVDLAPIELEADESLLTQVWTNLLHNAIKFTPPGGTIRVGLDKHNQLCRVTVSDNGIGIGEREIKHIFERFYKADRSRTRLQEGSGLGLSIVKKIVSMHRGDIDVQSVKGEGTSFSISLPMRGLYLF